MGQFTTASHSLRKILLYHIILSRIMNKTSQIIAITTVIVVMLSITNIPMVFAQTNQTGIEQTMKSAAQMNAMKATAPGDLVFVVICPPNFQTINDCQVFTGQPAG